MAQQQGRGNVLDNYVTVAERVAAFHQTYPTGRICTAIVEHDTQSGFILMRTEIFRSSDDAQPAATGHAFEVRGESYVNKTSYIENAETSSVGRALALLGFEVRRGIASREEMEKVSRMETTERAGAAERAGATERAVATDRTATTERAARPAPKRAEAAAAGAEGASKAATRAEAREDAKEEARAAAARGAEQRPDDLDSEILKAAAALGYDAPKVRKWVNQRFEVTGGLDSLTTHDKREILKIFRERVPDATAKTGRG